MLERSLRELVRTPSRLKSSVNTPSPCAKTSTRSPPEVLLPAVVYVRFPIEPSAKRKQATMLFSPIGKTETGHHVVFADRVLLTRGQRIGGNRHRLGGEQPVHQVHKMAGFAQNGATRRRIGHPI